jgi:hypothetical protein
MAIRRSSRSKALTVDRGNRSRTSDKPFFQLSSYSCCGLNLLVQLLVAFIFFSLLIKAKEANAGIASGFSLSTGEEYNDNIFFSNEKNKKNQSDFVTNVIPAFTFIYVSPAEIIPVLTINLSPEGQIFARHTDLDNFGNNLSFNTGYTYRYSPRLTFHIGDTFSRGSATRTIGLEAFGPPQQLPGTPTQQPPTGSFLPPPLFQDIGSLVTKGNNVGNFLGLDAAYLYAPNFTITGNYNGGYSNAGGGSEVFSSIGTAAIYNWRQEHNLFARYSVTFFDSHTGTRKGNSPTGQGSNVVHNFDIGDDYFSALKVQLDPTLTLSVSSGIGLNRGVIFTNGSLTATKVWQTATLSLAVRRGLGGSFGISGLATTTNVSSDFGIRLTEALTGLLGVEYALFNTRDVDFKVFRAGAGLQYWFTNWLSTNFLYSHRFLDGGSGAGSKNTLLVNSGKVQGNSVMLALSVHFDLWPNLGLARGTLHPLYPPRGVPAYVPPEIQQPLRTPPAAPQPPVSP